MLTCLKCDSTFSSREEASAHYSSRWHAFNLMTRVRGLPPISLQAFDEAHRQVVEYREEMDAEVALHCSCCNKSYSSHGSYSSHLNSKRHKSNEARAANITETDARPSAAARREGEQFAVAETDRAEEEQTDESDCSSDWEDIGSYTTDDESSKPTYNKRSGRSDACTPDDVQSGTEDDVNNRPTTPCLLCDLELTNLSQALKHLRLVHTFEIPHAHACRLDELYGHLLDMVYRKQQCLACSKVFSTAVACQQHMLSKPHLTLPFHAGYYQEDILAASLPPVRLPDATDEAASQDLVYQVTLANGLSLTHRDLRLYARQRLRPQPQQPPQKKLEQRRLMRLTGAGLGVGAGVKVYRPAGGGGDKQRLRRSRAHVALGLKANKLQTHFRLQVTGAG